jgi:membrane-bound serine protease (ClpP class)
MLRFSRSLSFLVLGPLAFLTAGCGASQEFGAGAVSPLDQLLAFLANPTVAYLLLVFGLLSVIAELATPGATIPGVLGAICLVLSGYGLLNLPTNWLGIVLIVAAVVMFLLDVKVAGVALSIGGLIAFALGSLLLFTPPWAPESAAPVARLNPWLIGATTLGVGAFFTLGVAAAIRAHYFPIATGRETLPGRHGVVKQDLAPQGIVHLEGEEWSAETEDHRLLAAGAPVTVVRVEGLKLIVTERAA